MANCTLHPQEPAQQPCAACGGLFCENCLASLAGQMLCANCRQFALAQIAGAAPAARTWVHRLRDVLFFVFLGLLAFVFVAAAVNSMALGVGVAVLLILSGVALLGVQIAAWIVEATRRR